MPKTYHVEVAAKFPPCGERPSIIEVWAATAKEAVSKARKEMWRNGHTRHDGPLTYRATVAKCSECGCKPRLSHIDLCEPCAENIGSRHDEDPYASARRDCDSDAEGGFPNPHWRESDGYKRWLDRD
jgi:hypothetical protein